MDAGSSTSTSSKVIQHALFINPNAAVAARASQGKKEPSAPVTNTCAAAAAAAPAAVVAENSFAPSLSSSSSSSTLATGDVVESASPTTMKEEEQGQQKVAEADKVKEEGKETKQRGVCTSSSRMDSSGRKKDPVASACMTITASSNSNGGRKRKLTPSSSNSSSYSSYPALTVNNSVASLSISLPPGTNGLRSPMLATNWVHRAGAKVKVYKGLFMAILLDHKRVPFVIIEDLQRSVGYDPALHDPVVFFERKGRKLAGSFGAVVRDSWEPWGAQAYAMFAKADPKATEVFQEFLETEVFEWLECEKCKKWRMYPHEDVILPRENSFFVCALAHNWNPAIKGCETAQEFSEDSLNNEEEGKEQQQDPEKETIRREQESLGVQHDEDKVPRQQQQQQEKKMSHALFVSPGTPFDGQKEKHGEGTQARVKEEAQDSNTEKRLKLAHGEEDKKQETVKCEPKDHADSDATNTDKITEGSSKTSTAVAQLHKGQEKKTLEEDPKTTEKEAVESSDTN